MSHSSGKTLRLSPYHILPSPSQQQYYKYKERQKPNSLSMQLKCSGLVRLFNTFPKLLFDDNLNAKHDKILPYTQISPHNPDGAQLYMFLEGCDNISAEPVQINIHNISCSSEWNHITEQGAHSQSDYIISSSDIMHLFHDTTQEDDLLSDHKGLSVRAPTLFPEKHTPSTKKFIPDWNRTPLIFGITNMLQKRS